LDHLSDRLFGDSWIHLNDFVNISNVHVGLFLQRSGRTLEETLEIAGWFARRFGADGPRDKYGFNTDLDTRDFTEKGWYAGRDGEFGPPAKRLPKQDPLPVPDTFLGVP
jgi:hypothetical protein